MDKRLIMVSFWKDDFQLLLDFLKINSYNPDEMNRLSSILKDGDKYERTENMV